MLFNSLSFLLFFAVYYVLHRLFSGTAQRTLIAILGSAFFYAWWNPAFIWVPVLLILIAWAGCRAILAATDPARKKRALVVTVVVLLVPLVFFKYTNFLYATVAGLVSPEAPRALLNLPLPLGISFISFTLLAYVADIYTGKYRGTAGLSDLSVYTMFFPHSIAGPILRPGEFLPQVRRWGEARKVPLALGSLLFAIGLLKKLAFADQLAILVDRVYAGNAAAGGVDYLLAIYGFSLQIYCDFSGYSDMAIGLALILGIRFPRNFNAPYTSASVVEFWRRWHITLSRWIRDYIYIPLGGNRGGSMRASRNILITMGLAGLWHGASWTFVAWGLAHALAIVWSHYRARARGRVAGSPIPAWIRTVVTFHFVTFAWILFRSRDLDTAMRVASGPFVASWSDTLVALSDNLFGLALILVFLVTHRFDTHARARLLVSRLPAGVIWGITAFALMLAVTVGTGSSSQFIYFEF